MERMGNVPKDKGTKMGGSFGHVQEGRRADHKKLVKILEYEYAHRDASRNRLRRDYCY